MTVPNKKENSSLLNGPQASAETETQTQLIPQQSETDKTEAEPNETEVSHWWQTAIVLWSFLTLFVLWGWTALWILVVPKPAASGSALGILGPAFYGLTYSALALIPVWALSSLLKFLVENAYPWGQNDEERGYPKYKFDGLAVVIGLIERLVVTCLLALEISGAGAFIGTWVLVKMASGWNRLQKGYPRYRARSIRALIMSLVSLTFAAVAAWLWKSTI